MQRRYSALGFVAGLYQLAGILITGGAILAGVLSVISSSSSSRYSYYRPDYTITFAAIVGGVIWGVGLYAVGELINLFRDMELNSRIAASYAEEQTEYARRTAYYLERLATRRQQSVGGSGQAGQASTPPPSRR